MLQMASQNRLLEAHMVRLISIVSKYLDIFRTGLSVGPPTPTSSRTSEVQNRSLI